MVRSESRERFIDAVRQVEAAVKALGDAYRKLGSAYDDLKSETRAQATKNTPVAHLVSSLASSIGPDRLNEAIFSSMLAHGLDPLLKRTAMRADGRKIDDLAGELAARLASV